MSNYTEKTKTKDLAKAGVFAALLCVISPFTIPIGPVGITLATFGVYLAGAVLGWKNGGVAVAAYLMLGLIGLPVFSGFSGGIQRLAGPTGGYLVGYIPCAVITGLFAEKIKKFHAIPIGMILGTVVLYLFGTTWYCIMSGSKILPALSMCVIPFLPGDSVKIACASVLGAKLRELSQKI